MEVVKKYYKLIVLDLVVCGVIMYWFWVVIELFYQYYFIVICGNVGEIVILVGVEW